MDTNVNLDTQHRTYLATLTAGEYLALLRARAGLTQAEVARAAEMTMVTVGKAERDMAHPRTTDWLIRFMEDKHGTQH